MQWRYVSYIEAGDSIHLQIEPMTVGADVVYVPNSDIWAAGVPLWA
jgi:hypothetical protein